MTVRASESVHTPRFYWAAHSKIPKWITQNEKRIGPPAHARASHRVDPRHLTRKINDTPGRAVVGGNVMGGGGPGQGGHVAPDCALGACTHGGTKSKRIKTKCVKSPGIAPVRRRRRRRLYRDGVLLNFCFPPWI